MTLIRTVLVGWVAFVVKITKNREKSSVFVIFFEKGGRELSGCVGMRTGIVVVLVRSPFQRWRRIFGRKRAFLSLFDVG